jgi:serine/threonine-protein kinase Chk1
LDEGTVKSFKDEELVIAKGLEHPNVLHFFDRGEEFIYKGGEKKDKRLFLVSDLCEKGELFDFILNLQMNMDMDGLPENTCRFLFTQIISGVEYLHGRGITHRDLKCDNIFLDQNASTRIADFGLSKIFSGEGQSILTTRCGTLNHMAPELSAHKAYDGPAVDVFACGVILFTMLTCLPPFE